MKRALLLITLIGLLTSCGKGIWRIGDYWEQQKPRKPYYGLSGRIVGRN